MTTSQIADTLAAHRVSADSWGWHCSCGAGERLSDIPMTEDCENPGKWEQADALARKHVATECLVDIAKSEIRDDIASGQVPAEVGTFSDLHDYVDANQYGGELTLEEAVVVQDSVDQWLRAGGHRQDA